MSASPRYLLLAVAVLAVVAAVTTSGCAATDQRQTTVVNEPASAEATGALTPLQRGQVRRQALNAARTGMDAWKRDDVAGIRSYFGTGLADFYSRTYASYAKAGRVRVRKYKDIAALDVVDLNPQGTEALVSWEFYDGSYVTDSSGKAITKPTNKDTSLQLTLDNKNGGWRIVRIIGGDEVLK